MIGRLRGVLAAKNPPYLLLDVGGVGYELQAPLSTIYQLPEIGATVTLLTYFHVREDAQVLYGFYEEREKTLFKILIKVSGIGPKMALGILSGMEVTQFIQCVEQRDITPLVRIPGIGHKTAERLVVEMAGKLKLSALEGEASILLNKGAEKKSKNRAEDDAVSALIGLGYKPPEASRAVSIALRENENVSSQELIRKALQGLARVDA